MLQEVGGLEGSVLCGVAVLSSGGEQRCEACVGRILVERWCCSNGSCSSSSGGGGGGGGRSSSSWVWCSWWQLVLQLSRQHTLHYCSRLGQLAKVAVRAHMCVVAVLRAAWSVIVFRGARVFSDVGTLH